MDGGVVNLQHRIGLSYSLRPTEQAGQAMHSPASPRARVCAKLCCAHTHVHARTGHAYAAMLSRKQCGDVTHPRDVVVWQEVLQFTSRSQHLLVLGSSERLSLSDAAAG